MSHKDNLQHVRALHGPCRLRPRGKNSCVQGKRVDFEKCTHSGPSNTSCGKWVRISHLNFLMIFLSSQKRCINFQKRKVFGYGDKCMVDRVTDI